MLHFSQTHNKTTFRPLLDDFKDDGNTVPICDNQPNKAKAWEAMHHTNALIEQSSNTTEQINMISKHGVKSTTRPSKSSSSS